MHGAIICRLHCFGSVCKCTFGFHYYRGGIVMSQDYLGGLSGAWVRYPDALRSGVHCYPYPAAAYINCLHVTAQQLGDSFKVGDVNIMWDKSCPLLFSPSCSP